MWKVFVCDICLISGQYENLMVVDMWIKVKKWDGDK